MAIPHWRMPLIIFCWLGSIKVGAIILILGFMHFFNMAIFFKLRNKALQHRKFSATQFPINPTSEIKG